ncbi:GSP1 [Ecytonucleospora hepatopenaei]|uniref:GSP1 n=1 Tax=Ecytonucleospora hepatopenaei TaxID=646526 RepID=A0A1W0E3F4_9MICR|nr:GSP1 [Ecytonucleospora hepatopenaei]
MAKINNVEIETSYTKQQLTPNSVHKFKICLIGEGGVGKTTFINKVLNGVFERKYIATQGAVTKDIVLCLGNNSYVNYEVWDTAGQEKYMGLRDGYYVGAVAGFFFVDVNSRETFGNLSKHIKSFLNACGTENPKLIICANKFDLCKKPAFMKLIPNYTRGFDVEVIQISAKTGLNYDKPFLSLTRYLYNDNTITLSADISMEALPNDYDFIKSADDAKNLEDAQNAAMFKPEE